MDEEKKTPEAGTENAPEVKYASPMKRLWAWVGVVYMVILVLLNTYALATAEYLRGIGGILLAPALAGLGGSAILRYREGRGRGGLAACIAVSGACFVLAVVNLVRAVPVLLSQL